MGKTLFITGTDTGVGKTLVTGFLARYLRERGENVVTQKWIETGCAGGSCDIAEHLRLSGTEGMIPDEVRSDMAPYTFKFPASPHLAASLEGKYIETLKIMDSLERLKKKFDTVLIEGVGGLLVPVTGGTVIADIVRELALPTLIVAGNRLGAINHTLLTVEALRSRRIEIAGIIFNRISGEEDDRILDDNPGIISKLTGVRVLADLPYSASTEEIYGSLRKALNRGDGDLLPAAGTGAGTAGTGAGAAETGIEI